VNSVGGVWGSVGKYVSSGIEPEPEARGSGPFHFSISHPS
jgi:hypothetical protein